MNAKNIFKISILLPMAGFLFSNIVWAATSPQDLKNAINEKAKALEEINQKLSQTQQELEDTKEDRQTLQKEIGKLETQLRQLNLGIKAAELTIDKYNLEIADLSGDIKETKSEIQTKKSGIGKLLKEISIKDNESILAVLLQNKSLAENLSEIASLTNLNVGLSKEVNTLEDLEDGLTKKLDLTSQKKQGVEKENKNLKNKKLLADETRGEKAVFLKQTKNKEEVYQQQLTELEKLQASISNEIEQIEAELRKNIDPDLLPLPRPGVLAHPTNTRITQKYGRTDFAIKTYASQYHNGIDFGGPIGTEIFAAEDGEVINVGNQDLFCPRGAYGKFIVIKHTNGLTTLYGHLSKYIVKAGQKVQRGEVVAYMGRTGWATGPHLHFTVFASNTLSPARQGFPEGTKASRVCGPMPVGGDLDPAKYL